MRFFHSPGRSVGFLIGLAALMAASSWGQRPPQSSPLRSKIYRHPALYIPNVYRAVDRLPVADAARAQHDLEALGVPRSRAFLDVRGGGWGTLMPATPLLPGEGRGNDLSWKALRTAAPAATADLERLAGRALREYVRSHREELRIDPGELALPRVTVHHGGSLIQIHVPRTIGAVPVRESYLDAVINHGNLVLLGIRNWGTVEISTRPRVSAREAMQNLTSHLAPFSLEHLAKRPELVIVPLAAGGDLEEMVTGRGYRYALAWSISPRVAGQPGRWQALVDAHSGELLSFEDASLYAADSRKVVGGVYPVSNDGQSPDGLEQAGFPMPHVDVTHGSDRLFTDSGGNLPACVDGSISTTLAGSFIRLTDFCGPLSESSAGDLDLGTGPGLDCDVPFPGTSSPGDTHASRTGYYELNRVREMALGQLPGNAWLQDQLTANVNIPDFGFPEFNCNAFWDEVTVNFFTSGVANLPGVSCTSTGELAGVLDHEWGHGLDANDANAMISNPPEGIADVYAALRLDDSCIGRGFFLTGNLCGDDDPCTSCDGVRDIDWEQRTSGAPHDLAWIDANCAPPFFGDVGPCGGGIHCEGAVYSEAVWDLLHRDLPASPFDLDIDTSREIVTRLVYQAAGLVGDWYQCVGDGSGTGDGCNADGGYLQLLAADDDNGDLGDGTPHMSAIHAAFDRHSIACSAPAVQNGGCSGGPLTAPVVTADPQDRGARLAWNAVAGATRYQVFRTEGVFGCDFGKAKVGETTALELVDDELMNDFEYYYTVLPVGSADSCLGPASTCVAVTPTPGPNLAFQASSATVELLNGDLDPFIDNCERARIGLDVFNLGSGTLNNVRLIDVQVVSHPGTVSVDTALPAPVASSLAPCAAAAVSFEVTAAGLAAGDSLELRVDVTADELLGAVFSRAVRLHHTESTLQPLASRTFTFETDLEGWEVVEGTFQRASAGGGANATGFYLTSSADLPLQCDAIRSPLLRLSPTSTLSVWNQFDIEPAFDVDGSLFWFDRANVGLSDPVTSRREPTAPDGGRLYNAGGDFGTCATTGQPGWADAMPSWAESSWSVAALASPPALGDVVQIDVRYGTDDEVQGSGFRLDEVTLTDFDLVVADGQTDACVPGNNPPVAGDDEVSLIQPGPVTVTVLDNDSDPDGDDLRVLAVADPPNGTAVVDSEGPNADTVTYTPDPGFGGRDTFAYSVTDERGGSAIAALTVDFGGIFSDGFESGGTSAWSQVTPDSCDPDGSYTLFDPISYSCCFGAVDLSISSFTFALEGATITSAPSNPVALTGAPTSCPTGSFTNAGSLPGGCTETYTLQGSFTGSDSWSGTYSATFVGSDCSCLDIDPCLDQLFPVDANR